MRFFITLVLLVAVVVDRWLKALALRGTYQSWPIGHFALVKNDALVFSWPAPNWLATVLMFTVIALIVWYMWRTREQRMFLGYLPFVFLLLGAISNVYDRLAYGYVVDWAFLGRWFPIFNLADLMITVGLLMILSTQFAQQRLTKQ